MTERTTFFEEAPGVHSMARLCAFICTATGNVTVLVNAAVLLIFAIRQQPIPEGMTAFGGMAVGLVIASLGGAWASLSQRKKSGDEIPQVVMPNGATVIQNQPVVAPP